MRVERREIDAKVGFFPVGTSELPRIQFQKSWRLEQCSCFRKEERKREIAGSPGSSPTAGQGRESAADPGNRESRFRPRLKKPAQSPHLTGSTGETGAKNGGAVKITG